MLKVMKKKLLVVIAMLVVASGIIFTGSTSTKAKDNDVKYLGKYKLTAYCGAESAVENGEQEQLLERKQNREELLL